jgi:hypothetical protein
MGAILYRFRAKLLEILALIVLCTAMYLFQLPLHFIASAAVLLAIMLYIYDHPAVFYFSRSLSLFALEFLYFAIVAVLLFIWQVDIVTSVAVYCAVGMLYAYLHIPLVRRAFIKAARDIVHRRGESIVIVLALILMYVWAFSPESMLFLTIFLAFLFYRWDSRITAGGALVSLIACATLLAFGNETYSEQLAVYAYYFLAMTVVLQVLELKRDSE